MRASLSGTPIRLLVLSRKMSTATSFDGDREFGTLKMLDWRFALTVGAHIAQALGAAHEKHVIHRNISPERILIRKKDNVAKLGDMTVARALEGIKARQITKPSELVGDIA